jgi:hypothetical protein
MAGKKLSLNIWAPEFGFRLPPPSTPPTATAEGRHMSGRYCRSIFAVAAAVTTFGATRAAGAQDSPVFVGTWTLNIDKTEPAKDRVIDDVESTGAGRTMSTGLGRRGGTDRAGDVAGGGGSRGGGGGARGGGGGRGTVRLIFGGMMMASKTLKVTQADSLVTIEDEDGPLFINQKSDNKTLEETLANQTVLKTKVQWRKNELVVERVHDTDGSARMIMKIDPKNPKTMVVDFHYEHKRQRRTIDQRRIYDAGM